LQWIYNILEKKAGEKILFEDSNKETGFVLAADYN